MTRLLYIYGNMKIHFSKYSKQVGLGFFAYAIGLDAMNHFYSPELSYKYWLLLLPGLPLVYLAFAAIRCIADSDEMWRKIFSEALAFSAIATGLTCFSYMFARDMGAPEFRGEWALYLVFFYYFVGWFLLRRRYK
jgi:hypothetical protein